MAASKAHKIEQECKTALAATDPILLQAEAALDAIDPKELATLKSMRTVPNEAVRLVMEILCCVREVKPLKVPDPSGSGRMHADYFLTAQKHVLSDSNLKSWLFNYDKDHIKDKTINQINTFLEMKELKDTDKVISAHRACGQLLSWVKAISGYHKVSQEIQPLRDALKEAKKSATLAQQSQDAAQSELDKVERRIAALQADLDGTIAKQVSLEKQQQECKVKLERAAKLLGGLSGEKSRWTVSQHETEEQLVAVVGDTLLSSAVIAYLGVFTASFRETAISNWVTEVTNKEITCSDEFSFIKVMGEPVDIQNWVRPKHIPPKHLRNTLYQPSPENCDVTIYYNHALFVLLLFIC